MQKSNPPQHLVEWFCQRVSGLGDRLLAYNHNLRMEEVMNSFKPRPDDIYIVSYPKSGTTLTQMMVYQLTSDGKMDIPHIEAVSPWFEKAPQLGGFEQLESYASPRLLKSHLRADQMPSEGRFIYLARNVADVAISSYHHICLIDHGFETELGIHLKDFFEERSIFGSWFKHVASWWPRRKDDNVLFLVYEEVIADLEGTVRRVADFCDLDVEEKDIARTVERTGLAFMKRYNHLFDPRRVNYRQGPEPDLIAALAPGVGADSMNPQQRKIFEKELGELTTAMGLELEEPSNPRAWRLG